MPLPASDSISPPTKTQSPSKPGGVKPSPLASWDSTRQQRHRAGQGLAFSVLLDESGSMGEHADALITAYNLLLDDLKTFVPTNAVLACWTFTDEPFLLYQGPLINTPSLTQATYNPGGGTHLATALTQVLAAEPSVGQKVLIVLTDGEDFPNQSACQTVPLRLKTSQQEGWLCVYLGAYPDALKQGLTYGFHEGNCLVFLKAQMAQAFTHLRESLKRFVLAAPTEQRLLSSQGIF